MHIQISADFSEIKLVVARDGSLIVQCPLWPTWDDIKNKLEDALSAADLLELESLWRSWSFGRKFSVRGNILEIKSA